MHSIQIDMDDMTGSIRTMSAVIGDMEDSTARMNQASGAMTGSMGRISVDMERMTRPESLVPMMPFR
jgi:hypothetical protein